MAHRRLRIIYAKVPPVKSIVTLTLNPTIDISAVAEVVRPLRKIRTTEERYHAGGGGISVARAIHALGGDVCALYLGGGPTGQLLDELLGAAGLDARRVPIAGHTRISQTIFERESGQEFRFVPEGPEATEHEWTACLTALAALDFDYVVISGSLPRGLPADAYHRAIDIAVNKRAQVMLDTSGPALRASLDKGVYLVKPSLGELEALVGRPLPDTDTQVAAARDLIEAGNAKIVALTCGRDGALVVSAKAHLRLASPPVAAQSAVGAGDSFLAAFTLALVQGRSINAALAYGVAAGTAAVLSPGAELCRHEDVERLHGQLQESAVGAF